MSNSSLNFSTPVKTEVVPHLLSTNLLYVGGKGHASPGLGAKNPKPPARETSLASAPPLAPAIGASTIGVWMPESGA